MNELTTFEYGSLDPETRIVVQQEDKEFDRNMGDAGASFVRACHNLKRIHEALKYKRPGFVEWYSSKPGLSDGTVHRMLNVAQMFSESENILPHSREAIYLLASPSTPEPARQEILQRAEQGEPITHKAAREIVLAHKQIDAERRQSPPSTPIQEANEEEEEELQPVRDEAPVPRLLPTPTAELPPAPRQQPKPPPSYPHSDQLVKWLRWLAGETHVIDVEQGGIQALTAEPQKWNRREVKEFIIPQLEDLRDTVDEYLQEIKNAFQ